VSISCLILEMTAGKSSLVEAVSKVGCSLPLCSVLSSDIRKINVPRDAGASNAPHFWVAVVEFLPNK
jgi:hypothetical protein